MLEKEKRNSKKRFLILFLPVMTLGFFSFLFIKGKIFNNQESQVIKDELSPTEEKTLEKVSTKGSESSSEIKELKKIMEEMERVLADHETRIRELEIDLFEYDEEEWEDEDEEIEEDEED